MIFEPRIERAYQLALLGDHALWDEFVRGLGLRPLDDGQRAQLRQMTGVPKLKGVLPLELRIVLCALTRDGVEIEREMLRFIGAAQPPKVALKGIFANAQRTAVRTASADSIHAVPCETCGAAPQADGHPNVCSFCGAHLA